MRSPSQKGRIVNTPLGNVARLDAIVLGGRVSLRQGLLSPVVIRFAVLGPARKCPRKARLDRDRPSAWIIRVSARNLIPEDCSLLGGTAAGIEKESATRRSGLRFSRSLLCQRSLSGHSGSRKARGHTLTVGTRLAAEACRNDSCFLTDALSGR